MGISLRHSGHFLVVGSAGGGSLRMRAINQLIGTTTKKYTAAAIRTKEMAALTKSPIGNVVQRTVNLRLKQSGLPTTSAISGVRKPLVSSVTTPPKAAPITTPTAISTTFPRRMNFLNPSSITVPLLN